MADKKEHFLVLTSELETAADYSDKFALMLETATKMRDMAKEVTLSTNEKIRIVKCFSKAKVRAFRGGTETSYQTYKALDKLGTEIVSYL